MSRELRIGYFAHTLRSDWNNGNAHFLRGLTRALKSEGHSVTVFEPATEWSIENLLAEEQGQHSLDRFARAYPDVRIETYSGAADDAFWREHLFGFDLIVLHEWNHPCVANLLLRLRESLGYRLLFHDTHHRASSSPDSFSALGLDKFDGVLAFGEALRTIYRERFGVERVWTFHEAADTSLFHPLTDIAAGPEIVWVGNWGDNERSTEIREYLLEPAAALQPCFRTRIYGVRYPADALDALKAHGVEYGGYLPNLDAPHVYASAKLTVHIPRQQYTQAMKGIPTIRVFEALACGIPLVSAPWEDSEHLFRLGDFHMATSPTDMLSAMLRLLRNPELAAEQAACGRETVLTHHTCAHRAQQLTAIFEEISG